MVCANFSPKLIIRVDRGGVGHDTDSEVEGKERDLICECRGNN